MYPDPQNFAANPNEFALLEMCGCRTPSDASSFPHNRIVFFVKIRAENYIQNISADPSVLQGERVRETTDLGLQHAALVARGVSAR